MLWIAVVAGAVLVVALVGTGVWLLVRDDDGVAMRIDDWVLTRAELDQHLRDVTGNVLYLQIRDRQGQPIPVPADGEPWDPDLVAEILTDELRFRIVTTALAQQGGSVSAVDREAARQELARTMAVSAQLSGGPQPETLDVVLDQFGSSRAYYEEGTATVAALRRVLAAGQGLPVDDPAAIERFGEVLAETARAARVEVAPDLGTWDPDAIAIVPVGSSRSELEPMEPGEPLDPGSSVPDDDGSTPPPTYGPPPVSPDGDPAVTLDGGSAPGGDASGSSSGDGAVGSGGEG